MARSAYTVRVRGVVQGVGFRPFVYRLAQAKALSGWVLNADEGVEIRVEGTPDGVDAFLRELRDDPPPASSVTGIEVVPAEPAGLASFIIRPSSRQDPLSVPISPDLAICARCLAELFDPTDRRYRYPYINCTDCGPRYSIVTRLPYDRAATTMAGWAMDEACRTEYHDPSSRRFHAQPVACPSCGPGVTLAGPRGTSPAPRDAIARAAALLADGAVLAIKGLAGYHLACDARNAGAVAALRARKFRKEKPFALMAKDLAAARTVVRLTPAEEMLLSGPAAPIVLAPALQTLEGVAPCSHELGVMLPYTPLHHLLFAAGAPGLLVMTSGNRSSEPIAYKDEDACERLAGMADAFLMGERPIARRVEDSVVRSGPLGPMVLRRSRGFAPGVMAALPVARPVLALGADLKNAVTLVVNGQAFGSQHIGDLEHFDAWRALEETIGDLLAMYEVRTEELLVVRDAHPQYRSGSLAAAFPGAELVTVQHHRAHLASVLAERGAWDLRVIGLGLDGTGYGDDGSIWGGELFVGSVRGGFERVAHLRPATLVGGDAAARHPVQAAAGFLDQLPSLPDLTRPPFEFPLIYGTATRLLQRGTRLFPTTSAGRLFDTAAALLGFCRPVSYEGQAAMWLEWLARTSAETGAYPCPRTGAGLDWRPLLQSMIDDRVRGRDPGAIARAFHAGLAAGLGELASELCHAHRVDTVVASGGVVQNGLLLHELASVLAAHRRTLWVNQVVPPNDGGISLGQAALGALGPCTSSRSH